MCSTCSSPEPVSPPQSPPRRVAGFTLLELLITIAIIAVASAVLVIIINPVELLKKTRDSQRLSDLSTMKSAIGITLSTTAALSIASTSVLYASLPDTTSTCANLATGTSVMEESKGFVRSVADWEDDPRIAKILDAEIAALYNGGK